MKQKFSSRRRSVVGATACALALFAGIAPAPANAADAWPTRTVRLLVGFPAGSTPDTAARALAEPLSRALGQAVIVENRPGASGNIATELTARATDDHTLGIVINGNLTSAKLLDPRLPFDPIKDFTYLSLLTTAPLVLVTPTNLPTGAAFFAEARKNGDKWNYGSVGVGSGGHLGMELLKARVGAAAIHVPYSGNPAVVTAMVGGQIQMALIPPGVAMPQVNAGKLHAVGVAGTRSLLVPELPSLAEAGVSDLNLEVWTALVGPASLSKAAQARLTVEVPRILREAATRQILFNQGWQAVGTSPEGLLTRVKQDTALLAGVIKAQGIKAE